MKSDFCEKVYKLVKLIPFGRVTTFGEIARMTGKHKIGRLVSKALRSEEFKDIPAYRVVYKNGKLCENYDFGGIKAQKQKLEDEGIRVKKNKVNLKEYGFYFW